MPVYLESLPPQSPLSTYTLKKLVDVLPDKTPYPCTIWATGKLVRFGMGAGSVPLVGDHSPEEHESLVSFFNSFFKKELNNVVALSRQWRVNQITGLRLYQSGSLIIDKHTLQYKSVPNPIIGNPYLTIDEVIANLPKTIPWQYPIYLSGGILKNGWSFKDADFIVFQASREEAKLMSDFLTKALNWQADVGTSIMSDREPVYLFKVYENGSKLV